MKHKANPNSMNSIWSFIFLCNSIGFEHVNDINDMWELCEKAFSRNCIRVIKAHRATFIQTMICIKKKNDNITSDLHLLDLIEYEKIKSISMIFSMCYQNQLHKKLWLIVLYMPQFCPVSISDIHFNTCKSRFDRFLLVLF